MLSCFFGSSRNEKASLSASCVADFPDGQMPLGSIVVWLQKPFNLQLTHGLMEIALHYSAITAVLFSVRCYFLQSCDIFAGFTINTALSSKPS